MPKIHQHLDQQQVVLPVEREPIAVGDLVSFRIRRTDVEIEGTVRQMTKRGWAYVDAGSGEFPYIWRLPADALSLLAREGGVMSEIQPHGPTEYPWSDLDRDELLALLPRIAGLAPRDIDRMILSARYDVALRRTHAAEDALSEFEHLYIDAVVARARNLTSSKTLAKVEAAKRAEDRARSKARRLRRSSDALWDQLYPKGDEP